MADVVTLLERVNETAREIFRLEAERDRIDHEIAQLRRKQLEIFLEAREAQVPALMDGTGQIGMLVPTFEVAEDKPLRQRIVLAVASFGPRPYSVPALARDIAGKESDRGEREKVRQTIYDLCRKGGPLRREEFGVVLTERGATMLREYLEASP